MVAEVGWYSFRQQDLVGHLGFINNRAKRCAPVVSDWTIRKSSCPKDGERRQQAMHVLTQTAIVWMQAMAQGTCATALKDTWVSLISPRDVKVKYILEQNFLCFWTSR
jgi:hypothetical protein